MDTHCGAPRQRGDVSWHLISIALTVSLIAASCTRGFDETVLDDPDPEPVGAGEEVTAIVGADGVHVELEGVATLEVPADALPPGATVTLRRIDPPQSGGEMLERVGPAVDVAASVPLVDIVRLTLPFDRDEAADDLPAALMDVLADEAADVAESFGEEAVAVARLAGDGWKLLDSQVDLDARAVTADLDRLSTFAPVGGTVDWLANVADRIWRAMLGIPRPDPPSCAPPPNVTVTGLGEWGCATVDGDDWLTVHIVNGQGFAVDLTLPDGAERTGADHPQLSEPLVALVGEKLRGSNVAWLPPAASVSYRVPYDPDTTMRYQFRLEGSMDSAAATVIAYLLDSLLSVTGVGSVKDAMECGHQMGYVLDTDSPAWLVFTRLLWDTARCVGWQFAALLKSPLTVAQALLSVGNELLERLVADLAGGYAWSAVLTVSHDLPAPPDPDEPAAAAGVSRIVQRWGVFGPAEPLGGDGADGSGCSPGTPDTLPDGVWFGFVADLTATEVAFDLACLYTGEEAFARMEDPDAAEYHADFLAVNDSPALRRLPVATDARFFPIADPYESGDLSDRIMFGPQDVDAFWAHLASREPFPGTTDYVELWKESVGVWILVEDGELLEILEFWFGFVS